jgi:hypothetical protein
MVAGANVFRVAVYLNSKTIPNSIDPWPDDAVTPTTLLTPDPVTQLISYTIDKPDSAHEVYVQFEARLDDLTIDRDVLGTVRRAVVQSNPSALTATLHGAVSDSTVDLSASVEGSAADWPVLVEFFVDSPLGAAITSKSISANATLDKLTSGLSALGALTLPQREARRFFIKLTNVANQVAWGEPIAIDRDSLPYGYVTLNDYRAAPVIKVNYDDDTDSVKIYLPGGKTKTFTGLTGAGVATYTVGDLPDVGSAESALAIDESRSGYQVDVHGGGTWLTVWGGALAGTLHGVTTGPSLSVQVTPGATSMDIAWSGTGTITLSIDGGAFSTPPASPILGIARHATNDKVYRFKSVQASQTLENTVIIPSLQKDQVTPDMTVTPGTPAQTTQPLTVVASNPAGGTAPTINVTPYNCSMVIAGVTYTTVQAVASGTVVTVNRPSTVTDTQAHVKFDATIAGGGSESIDMEIVSQLNFGPTLNVQVTPGATPTADASIVWSGTGTITVSIDGAAYTTPSASPITVVRHATLDKSYTFKAVKDGQDIVNTVTVPSLKSDGLVPDLDVSVGTQDATHQYYTVNATNPRSGGTAPSITARVYGPETAATMTIGGVTYHPSDGAVAIASGTQVIGNRPDSDWTQKSHIEFNASISGGGAERTKYTLLNQLNIGPVLIVTPTPGDSSYSIDYSGTGTITYSVDGGSYTSPGGSPLSVSRNGHDQTITFKCVRDGQTITAAVTVPALPPPSSTGFSVDATAWYSPCDGGGSCSVDVSGGSFPDGVTYDAIVDILTGTYFGSVPLPNSNFTPGASGNVSGAFCPGEDARVTVVVRYGGEIIASASTEFTS